MNYDPPAKKQKKLSPQGRRARKPKRKTNNEQAAFFFSLRKNARSHDGNFAVHFGKQAAPPRTTGHFLSPSFMRLPMGCAGGPCTSSAANGEALTPNSTVGPRGASGRNPLSNSSRGRTALILNASWLIPRQRETISRQWEPRAETNASAGGRRPDNENAHDCRWRVNPPGFTITAGNVRDSKETLSLIQISEAKYLPKAGKHDVEKRGQRCFLGDKGHIGSIIERILAVKGRISARVPPQKQQETQDCRQAH